MKILMLSEDSKILEPQSEATGRMQEYADVLGELHIVVTGKGTARHNMKLFTYSAKMRMLGMLIKGWQLCKKNKFDTVSVQEADDVGLAGFFLARFFHIPFQLQIHTDVLSPWYRRASWKEYARYWIACFLIPRTDSIRVVSDRIKNSILCATRHAPRVNIFVLPIFTDLKSFFEAKRNPEIDMRFNKYDFKMIAVGRFVEKEKNFLMLIDIMRDVVNICHAALLIIVGEGPDRKNYELRIKNYGLEKNVLLESWRNDLPVFYKSFDLFLLSSNYEGWGRVALEAMASGLPVVMTDVGLAGEVVRHEENGLVVPVQNRAVFLHAIEDLYKKSEKRRKLTQAGLETIKNLEPRTKGEYLEKYKESFKLSR